MSARKKECAMNALNKISSKSLSAVKTFARDEEAATAAEYGILAALVAVAIIGAVTSFGGGLKTLFQNLTTQVQKSG
jgi:pilus assembly protein Flp/PilA